MTSKFIILFLCTSTINMPIFALRKPKFPRLDQSRIPKSGIINGERVKAGDRSFQVSLRTNRHFCGGSIITPSFIVTAAHCLENFKLSQIKVVVGTVDIRNRSNSYGVIKIAIHEGYNPFDPFDFLKNDIALIKINDSIAFNIYVKAVSLPILHSKIATGTPAIVSGWGKRGRTKAGIPTILQKAEVFIVDQDTCRATMKKKDINIFPTQLCASGMSRRKGQCNGDSGGPLTVNGTLVGIVSWSIKDPECGSTKYPGVYTRVSEFVDWIQKKVNEM